MFLNIRSTITTIILWRVILEVTLRIFLSDCFMKLFSHESLAWIRLIVEQNIISTIYLICIVMQQ